MIEAETSARERLQEIQRQRRLSTVASILSFIAGGQVVFAAFAFGHSRGPVMMRPLEVLGGMVLAFVAAVLLALLARRRRLESSAKMVVVVDEGRHQRRIAVFDDFFTIGPELVLFSTLEPTKLDRGSLILRYVDPLHHGPVLRVLEGDRAALERLAEGLGGAPDAFE